MIKGSYHFRIGAFECMAIKDGSLLSTADFAFANAPQEGRWYWEPAHCRATLGEEVLRRLFGHAEADVEFGTRLNPQSLPRYLEQVRHERCTILPVERESDCQS